MNFGLISLWLLFRYNDYYDFIVYLQFPRKIRKLSGFGGGGEGSPFLPGYSTGTSILNFMNIMKFVFKILSNMF